MNQMPLICVPFAGAGASFFYPWNELAADELALMTVQLPGREWRLAEEPYTDAQQAADALFLELADELGGSGPVMLFGHSLGAVLAFELARRFCDHPGFDVARLMVSGSPGPWTRRTRRATGLADEEFFERVSEFAEYSDETLRNPEVRELILPVLRADVEMHENYVPLRDDPLPAPILSIRGAGDQLVPAEQAAEWSDATSREFELLNLPGGHMYLMHSADEVLRIAAQTARAWRSAPDQAATAR